MLFEPFQVDGKWMDTLILEEFCRVGKNSLPIPTISYLPIEYLLLPRQYQYYSPRELVTIFVPNFFRAVERSRVSRDLLETLGTLSFQEEPNTEKETSLPLRAIFHWNLIVRSSNGIGDVQFSWANEFLKGQSWMHSSQTRVFAGVQCWANRYANHESRERGLNYR